MTIYLLGTYVNTFIEPVIRQLVLLEQEYETDQVILSLAANKAQLMQKFGMDQVTDDLLRQELTIKVNVGMGATDPNVRLQKFLAGTKSFGEMFPMLQAAGMDAGEVWKEIAAHMGYQDGLRFFGGEDPEKVNLKKKLQHAGQVIQELGKRAEDKQLELKTKKEIAHEGNVTKLLIEDHKQGHENTRALAGHIVAIDGAAAGREGADKDRELRAGQVKAKK